jgi:phosphohistidine phosphatase
MSRARELWILRHAEAESTGPEGDASRRLTRDGRHRAREVGRSLADRGLRPGRVVSSPYLRARETAEIAAAEAAPGLGIELDPGLEPGGDPGEAARAILRDGALPALLVGHNPDLSELVLALTGSPVAMRKGMLVRLEFGARGRARIAEVL